MRSDLVVSLRAGVTHREGDSSPNRLAWFAEGGAVVFTLVLRYWITRGRTFYGSHQDEASGIAIARTLAGARPFHSNGISFDTGFGTLISPIYRIVEDPELAFRTVLMVNVLLAVLTLLVLRSLVMRLLDVAGPVAIWCSAIGLALPGVAMQTMYSGSECLVAFVVALVLLLAVRLEDAGRPWFVAMGLAVAASVMGIVHARMLGAVLAVVVVLVASSVFGRLPKRIAFSSAAVLLILTWVLLRYNGAVHDRIWLDTAPDASHRFDVFSELLKPLGIMKAGAGMLWHQMVVTFALVLVGLGYLFRTSIRTGQRTLVGLEERRRINMLVILVAAAVPGMIYMAVPRVAGHMIYGRYWDPLALPVVAVGVGCLFRLGSRQSARALAASVLVTGAFSFAFYLARQDAIDAAFNMYGFSSPRRIIGLVAFADPPDDRLNVAKITLQALVAMAGLLSVVTLTRLRHGLVTLVALAALVSGATVRASIHNADSGWHTAKWRPVESLVDDDLVPKNAEVGFRLERSVYPRANPTTAFMGYQFFQPDVEFVGLEGRGVLEYGWVVSDESDQMLRGEGWTVIWEHPGPIGIAIWEDPDWSD